LLSFTVIWTVHNGVEFSAVEGRCLSEKKALTSEGNGSNEMLESSAKNT